MNKIEALNENALEAAVLAHDKEESAMRGEPDPWAGERPADEFSDRKAAMALAISAYLSAAASDVSGLVDSTMDRIIQECETERLFLGTVNAREVIRKHIARSLTALEADNARLRARLAEALKALEKSENLFEAISHHIDEHSFSFAKGFCSQGAFTARRVREGGKVE